jgi:predicted GH43/DUF377 family glycosyl hydrolase
MMTVEITGFSDVRNFNPSICTFNGKPIMAYRAEDPPTGIMAKIMIGTFDAGTMRIENPIQVKIPWPQPHTSLYEDPRLFVHDGKLWLSFIAATFKEGHHFACQGIARLDENFQPDRIFYPDAGYNKNDVCEGNGVLSREKNWTFFSHKNQIHVIYTINPMKVGIMNEDSGRIEFMEMTMFDSDWKWGEIHGSTPPIKVNDKLIASFHSFDFERDQRRYHFGFYEIDPIKWRVTRISNMPWMSAFKDESQDMRSRDQDYRPLVVFPCGLSKEKEWQFLGNQNTVAISYGWNDCRSMLAFEDLSDILKSLKQVPNYYEYRYKIRDCYQGLPGGFNCEVRGISLRASHFPGLVRRAKSYSIPEIELHDVICKRIEEPFKSKQWHLIK